MKTESLRKCVDLVGEMKSASTRKRFNEADIELENLLARLAEAEKLLKKLEWTDQVNPNYNICLVCGGAYYHRPDCELEAFLAVTK